MFGYANVVPPTDSKDLNYGSRTMRWQDQRK